MLLSERARNCNRERLEMEEGNARLMEQPEANMLINDGAFVEIEPKIDPVTLVYKMASISSLGHSFLNIYVGSI